MPRPVMLGIVGDSGSGKTTITRGLVRVLGAGPGHPLLHRRLPPLRPASSAPSGTSRRSIPTATTSTSSRSTSQHLRSNEAIMKPVYQHTDGTFGPPDYFVAGALRRHRGAARLLRPRACATASTSASTSTRPRSSAATGRCSATARGAATRPTRCSAELDRREPDSEAFIRPQRHHADIVVSFQPSATADQEHLDCKLTLRDSLPHPDLTRRRRARTTSDGIVLDRARPAPRSSTSPARSRPERAPQIEEAIWERMHFARHLRAGGARRVHDRHRAPPLRLARRSSSC